MNNDGLTFTKQCIQTGLNIDPKEKDNIVTIHNMVSFFSNEKIYLIVPKRGSMSGELQLAPISNQINYLLKDLDNNILDIVQRMYGLEEHMLWQQVQELYNPTEAFESVQLHRINKYVYVEGAKICYTYVYDLLVHTPNNAYALIKDKLIGK